MKNHSKKYNQIIITTLGACLLSSIPAVAYTAQRLSETGIAVTYPEDLSPNLYQETTESQVVVGRGSQEDSIIITAYEIDSIGQNQETATENELTVDQDNSTASSDEPLQIVGKLLNYPNPFSLRDGGTIIRYQLNKDASIELRIYDQFANEILRDTFAFGQNGGAANSADYYNKVQVKKETFNTTNIPAGIYFYALLSEGTVLGKGKMAIVP